MSKIWIYQLMNDSINYCDREGLQRQRDLIESTPFGLINDVFSECVCIHQVIQRATDILLDLDNMEEPSFYNEPDQDDDPDWYEGSPVIPLHKLH